MNAPSSESDNPFRPPNTPPDRPASRRTWLRLFLGTGCILFACVGLICLAAGLAVVFEAGAVPSRLVGSPRGRLMLLLLGGFAVGTARWFVAARACFRGEWRAVITNSTLGLGFVVGPFVYLIRLAQP